MKKPLMLFSMIVCCLLVFVVTVFAADSLPTRPSLDYLQTQGTATQTIVAHERLTDILYYNGTARNMNIAKWIRGYPQDLEYPAYCFNPGIKGVNSHPDDQYEIKPVSSLTDKDKKVLGIFRAGYPFKSPSELGVESIQDAFYATQTAIWNYIENGDDVSSLNNWTANSGNAERNNKILTAMKNIYNEGRLNPYSPPEIIFKLEPDNDGTASEEGDWYVNVYEITSSYPFITARLVFDDAITTNLAQSGKVKVTSESGTPFNLKQYINGVWDTAWGYEIPSGTRIKVWYGKELADAAQSVNIKLRSSIATVSLAETVCYIGTPTISGEWQGYAYSFVPRQYDESIFKMTTEPIIIIDDELGNLTIQKLDWHTKKPVDGALFHIKGITFGKNTHINLMLTATQGATLPTVSDDCTITITNGVIKISGLPIGVYEITEVSPPPCYENAEGQNSRSVEVVLEQSLAPVVTFENKKCGSLTINKVDSLDISKKIANVWFKVECIETQFSGMYATGSDGSVTIDNLMPGSYKITEVATRPGYIPSTAVTIGNVNWNQNTQVTIKNDPRPNIEIIKVDGKTNESIADVFFKIKHKNNPETYVVKTDSDGRIVLEDVLPGWYDVVEVSPAPGYAENTNSYEVHAEVGQNGYLIVKNYKLPNLTINKIDSITKTPLKDAKFEIYQMQQDWVKVDEAFSNANGEVSLTGLQPDRYKIVEVLPPNNYVENKTPVEITLLAGEDKQITIENLAKPSLTILKLDKDTKKPLANAQFSIWRAVSDSLSGELVEIGKYMTNAEGKIELPYQESGWYRVEEIQAPPGYILNSETQDVFLEAGKDKGLLFENIAKPVLEIKKVDKITNDPLPNAEFTIWRAVNNSLSGELANVGSFRTDEDGIIRLENQETGWYRIKETITPSGYIGNTENYDVFLEAGRIKEIIIENQPKSAIIIKKVDEDTGEPLVGAKFRLRYLSGVSGTGGTVIGEYQTSYNGTIVITDLKPGSYVVEEIQAPSNYIISDEPKTVWLEDKETAVVIVEVANRKNVADLIIKKLNAKDNQPLAGAEFKITTADGAVVGNSNGIFVSDASGIIMINDLEPGAYIVQEIKAPSGFIIDDSSKTIELKHGNTYTLEFYNTQEPSLIIKKLDSESKNPLAGAEFKLAKADGAIIGTYTTDENGLIIISNLEPGAYVIQEIKAPDGYVIESESKTINIEKGKTYTIEFFNTNEPSLVIKKLDSDTKQALAGAEFKITDSNGNLLGDAGGIFKTDENGLIILSNLEPDTLIIQEYKAPPGYVMDQDSKTVKIEKGKVYTVEFYNTIQPSLIIKKLDSNTKKPLANAEFKITYADGSVIGSNNGIYVTDEDGLIRIPNIELGAVIVTEIKAPSGYIINSASQTVQIEKGKVHTLEFFNTVKADLQIIKLDADTRKPISGAEFTLAKINGQRIGTYRTNSSGLINIASLEDGWYTIVETKAPQGYKIYEEPRTFEIIAGKPVMLEFTNQKMSSVLIHKIDSVTKKGIYGVTFLLYDSKNNPIGQYTTDQDGYIYIDNELEPGKYLLKELKPAEGYAPDDKVRTIYIEAGRTTEVTWENTANKGQIIITKLSADYNHITNLPANSPLQGAVFEVYNLSGNIVETITSDNRGIAATDPLSPGIYLIQEVTPPAYYQLNDKSMVANIKHDGDQVKFEVYNASATTIVIVQKKSNDQVAVGQILKYEIFNVGNASDVPLESFYLHDRLPTDAVRGVKLFTGTWNQRLAYAVYYKTNYKDYRVLSSGLSSSINYELSLHSNVLGLAAGEYVTDIKYEFGKVNAGFHEIAGPVLLTQVLPTLPNNYVIINRVDVGGKYLNEWEIAKDVWRTTVSSGGMPPTIPKTGY